MANDTTADESAKSPLTTGEASSTPPQGSPDSKPQVNQPGDESPQTAEPWTLVVGGVVWICVAALILIPQFWTSTASIALEVTKENPLSISGVVLYGGAPVKSGYVRLTLDEAKTKSFLSSSIVVLTNRGEFTTSIKPPLEGWSTSKRLRITAQFEGQRLDKDNKTVHTTGETVVYTNYSPPIGQVNVLTWATIAVGLMLTLMVLFTGSLTRRKARCLFAVTYLCTFISLAVPLALVLVISQNNYLVEAMQESPVGLVKAKAKGVPDPQWLLNIGGIIRPDTNSHSLLIEPNKAVGEGITTPTNPSLSSIVVGGLAIPFYVIMLAMFGAGINMTRQVPDIQKRYDFRSLQEVTGDPLAASISAPVAIILGDKSPLNETQTNTITGIRKEIIESYMGLLSAPFIAIAIYYVLQIIASNVAEPILVIMAFATGLISDSVVSWIIEFAQKTLQKKSASVSTPATTNTQANGNAPTPTPAKTNAPKDSSIQ